MYTCTSTLSVYLLCTVSNVNITVFIITITIAVITVLLFNIILYNKTDKVLMHCKTYVVKTTHRWLPQFH